MKNSLLVFKDEQNHGGNRSYVLENNKESFSFSG